MEIVVRAREVYGNTLLYPANAAAEALARIAGTKTLSWEVLTTAVEHLGVTWRMLGPAPTFPSRVKAINFYSRPVPASSTRNIPREVDEMIATGAIKIGEPEGCGGDAVLDRLVP